MQRFLTNLKTTLKDLLRTLRDEARDETRPAFGQTPALKPLVIYTAEPRHEGWVVARRGTWVFGPWAGDAGRERALQIAQRLEEFRPLKTRARSGPYGATLAICYAAPAGDIE